MRVDFHDLPVDYYSNDVYYCFMHNNGLNRHIDDHGTIIYRDNDKRFHREDGPAIEYRDGSIYWYIYGKLHRLDGPAIEYSGGFPVGGKEWWVEGINYPEELTYWMAVAEWKRENT